MAFADRSLEERFLSQHRDDTAEYLRWACLVGAAIMIGFMWQDSIISASGYKASEIRLFGALPVGALAWYLSRNLGMRRFISYISAFFWLSYACFTAAIFIIYEPGPYGLTSSIGLGSFLLLLFGVFTFSNLRLWASLPVGLLTLLVYAVSVALWTEADFGDFIVGDFLTAVALVIGTATKTLFTERAQRRLFETSKLLRESYTMVEQQVRERTAELQGINTQLTAEIAVRMRAEEEKAALQEQLRQSQKMEGIGQLAGGIAHDFNNLLTVIRGNCEFSLMDLKEDDPQGEGLKEAIKASDRASALTRQLLAFSRRQVLEAKILDLNYLFRNLEKMLRRLISENIDLVMILAEGLGRVKVDPGQIEQIILNLAVNARDAMPSGGKLTIETVNVELDEEYARTHIAVIPGPHVMFSVSDTGVGITKEIQEKIFEPFFTTKEIGKGTGLGLSTVYGIVKQSGGNIWVYSEPGQGTTFKIYLPRVYERLEERVEKKAVRKRPQGVETILLVEDEETVREITTRILKMGNYRVLVASNGDEVVEIVKKNDETIHLMLTDVVMPGMSGRELGKWLIDLYPGIKVLYMSGYTDGAITQRGILDQGMDYIQKPFTMDGLLKKVREVLDK